MQFVKTEMKFVYIHYDHGDRFCIEQLEDYNNERIITENGLTFRNLKNIVLVEHVVPPEYARSISVCLYKHILKKKINNDNIIWQSD